MAPGPLEVSSGQPSRKGLHKKVDLVSNIMMTATDSIIARTHGGTYTQSPQPHPKKEVKVLAALVICSYHNLV